MNVPRLKWMIMTGLLMVSAVRIAACQVFTVGEKTATADINTSFKATRVELPEGRMTERGRRELVRGLEAEQGFAHRVLPLGAILTLHANGNLTTSPEEYKRLIYAKGQAAAPGDRVAVSSLEIKSDRIIVDLNGGPYLKHRFMRHVQIGVGGAQTGGNLNDGAVPTGCRITLLFEGGVPEVSAPEVKALLEPLVDFGVKTGEQAYADTLPPPVKSAIESHEVLVGMDRRMVLAALGAPESKVRETDASGVHYEEWIYGHQPQTLRFVRFSGDKVSLVKVAATGKAIETHDQDEMAGYQKPQTTHTIEVGNTPDSTPGEAGARNGPPTLRMPGEPIAVDAPGGAKNGRVQYPVEKKVPPAAAAGDAAPKL